jgi:beta-glucanase (GH16 family)
MSCAPRVLGVPVSRLSLPLLLLVALLVAGTPSAATAASVVPARPPQSVDVTVLPPIAQPGSTPAAPESASTVLTATVRPKAWGRPTHLEVRHQGRWSPVATASTGAGGRVMFTAPTTIDGRAATYRVRAAAFGALGDVHSEPVRADAWGSPAFVDGFDGVALGPSWEHRIQFHNPWGGRACSKGDPSAVLVSGGTVRLSVFPDPALAGETCPTYDAQGQPSGTHTYRLNGHISTQSAFDFQYGVAAARIRFQRHRGQHGAFWMQPRGLLDTGPTPWGAEIDVVEWYGAARGRERMSNAVHRHTDGGEDLTSVGGRIDDPDRFLADGGDRWWTGYHVFSVEWTPHEYVFRIDGQQTTRIRSGVSHHPEFLILSMLSSDFELDLIDDEALPQHLDVDWVAAWPLSNLR